MTTQCCYLPTYDWLIKVFYEASYEDADVILDELDAIDCEDSAFKALKELLSNDLPNSGFTYTDASLHVTIIVISKTTCAAEFQNTLDHEKGHAAVHIAEAFEIDMYSEEFQYLQGKIGQELFKVAKRFLCDHCRINFVNFGKIKVKF